MVDEPNTSSADANRESVASPEEALINRLKAGIESNEIWGRALDLLRKRMESGELSDNMLLRVTLSLAKSTACFTMDGRPQVTRQGRVSRSGRQSRRPPTRR